MKTFTTYAEKKAKQILNLLQGYTKGIRFTAMLMLLVVGTSNAWGQTVLFFQDNIGMSGRYAYFYSSSYWNESNGAGSKNIASQCNSMTKLGNNGTADIYVYQHSTTRKYVAVMQDSQSSYDNFWQTQGCAATYDACDGLYDIKNPMMIPNKGSSWKKNNDQTTYYNFSWGIPTVWIKHPFGGGDWTFKQMTYNNDGTFTLDANYTNGSGCNYGCKDGDETGWIASPTKTPSDLSSHLARFKMTFSGGSINMSITKLCVVTFNMNDHGSAINSQNILYNNKATQPSNPTATGYTFGGWYTDAACTNAFNFNNAITDDITLYAKWTANENFFNVTAVANPTAGGTVTPTTATSMGQNTGDDITATAKTGYTFNNWTIKSGSGYFGTSGTNITSTTANTKFRPTATSTVQANFTENLTTITITASPTAGGTLTVDGNTFASGNTVTAGVTTSHSVVANANVGYEFNKWTQGGNSSASRSGNSVTLKGNGNSGTGTLTAHFAPIEYSITYKDQGGGDFSGTHASGYPTTHTYDSETTLKTATKTGYTFEGWFTNSNCTGTAVTSLGATDYTANITLYAKWTAVPTTVYLKPNSDWKQDNARFAIYWWNNSTNGWVELEGDCNSTTTYYSGDVPAGVTNFQFVRLKPSSESGYDSNNSGLNFNNAWNQTGDLTLQDGKYLYDLTQDPKEHIYLKPNSNWKTDNARFAACYKKGDTEHWASMFKLEEADVYWCDIPSGSWDYVILCRMTPDNTTNNWNNRWNQTSNLNFVDGKNLFTINDNSWSEGTWSTWWDNCYWSNETPTYTVSFNQPTGGTVSVTKADGSAISSGSGVALNSKINVTITPDAGYAYANTSEITIGSTTTTLANGTSTHTICGETTINAKFTEITYTVNIRTSDATQGTVSPETLQVGQYTAKSITATAKSGSAFSHWIASDGITITDANDATTTIKATANGTVTAYFSPAKTIYLKPDHTEWTGGSYQVYVWADGIEGRWIDMTQVTSKEFYQCSVPSVYTDILFRKNDSKQTIDLKILEHCNFFDMNDIGEYNGKWMEYDAWHIASGFNNWEPCGYKLVENEEGLYTFTKNLTAGNYDFKIVRNGTWYGNNGDMSRDNCTKWTMSTSDNDCTLQADIDGDYIFQFDALTNKLTVIYPELPYYLVGSFNNWTQKDPKYQFKNGRRDVWLDASTQYTLKVIDNNDTWYGKTDGVFDSNTTELIVATSGGDISFTSSVEGSYTFLFDADTKKLSVILPEVPQIGDYRLAYMEGTTASTFHPGHLIRKSSDSEQYDTISFFIGRENTPKVLLQKYNGSTWATITNGTYDITVDASGVYNFVLKQTNEGANAVVETNKTHAYEGDYYIRTNCADGEWNNFKIPANLMTYSSYADDHENFDHYFCKWVVNDYTRFAFTIANDYSYCISDTLKNDSHTNDDSSSKAAANVRFAWDSKTNELSRAYIDGSGESGTEYLQLRDAVNLKNVEQEAIAYITFNDLQNWIYQVDVYASKDTRINLTAKYNGYTQYFKGGTQVANKVALINSTSDKFYKIRLIYDFKTNHLISAWLAGGNTVDEEGGETLGADMMTIRIDQNTADQLQFNPESNQLKSVGKAYAVMTFTEDFIFDNTKTQYERALYWVSFPFDVKISDVFGFGEYGEHWIMEYYDGADRAKNGLWADTDTYWKYYTNKNTTLKKGKGYVLALNLSKVMSSFINGVKDVSLYFPSTGDLSTITGEFATDMEVPSHKCTITRDNRNIYDSHWNMIGVPGFIDVEEFNTTPGYVIDGDLSFYYEYLPRTNTYQVTNNTTTFQTMYGYMLQFAGTLNWQTKTGSYSAIAARRIGTMPDKYSLRLEMAQNDELVDQTYIELHENKATADFDMNIDLTKILNNSANIYTLTANTTIMVAGNALPMEKVTVPVGVMIATAGTYTFRMPDGTDGIAVTLVDNATGTHTNMLMDEYTVTLDAGTIENRFYLMVDPDRTATSVENIGEEAKGEEAKGQIKKFLIDGKLFIRTADGIFDAKGQRM